MSSDDSIEEAVEVLQQLGLKEYEAKCFVGLSRLRMGTAKRLSEITDVPRTRVYDAIRVLEAQGLVEVQHSSPQRFRAVSLDEATETLRDQYEERIERFSLALEDAEELDPDGEQSIQEIWSLAGTTGIENRTDQLIAEAGEEVVLVVGDESILTPDLTDGLSSATADCTVLLGAVDEPLRERLGESVPSAETFVSGLDWLRGPENDDEVAIGRLVLIDRSTILISTIQPDTGEEHAIFGSGFGNGLVVIFRRLMGQGLLTGADL